MEKISSSSSSLSRRANNNKEEGFLSSCWGNIFLKLKLPWGKQKIRTPGRLPHAGRSSVGGRFRYDPLSYSQNFDDGCWEDDIEASMRHGFSSRFAAPVPAKLGVNKK